MLTPDAASAVIVVGAAALGSCFGSFGAAMWDRTIRGVPRNDPPRSECPKCHTVLRWNDNIPVISYLLLRGRCRQCMAVIPTWYLVWELVGGAVGLGIWCGITLLV